MKTILVPTDFSKYANDALEYAVELANVMLAKVRVVHIIEQQGADNFDTFADGYGGSGMEGVFMIKLIEKAKKDLAAIKSKYDVEADLAMSSSATKEIMEYAGRINADLIIMGSKGTNSVNEELIGSNTEKVVRTAKCPIITIKEKSNSRPKNIVFASDFKNVDTRVIENIKEIQKMFNSKLHLLRVSTPHNFETTNVILDKMNETAKKFELSNYETHIYNDFYEEDGISNFAAHHDMDLVCLATSGRTGLAHFFTGSIAEDVVNHAYTPVMTFNLKTMNK